ncbi:MAG TPA: hypothetical protein VFW87_07815 [Pirellulales bacterium]|nr:hypothetical protein [Pirellulales bacterium]
MRSRIHPLRFVALLLPVIAAATVVAPLPSYIPFGDPRPTLAFLNAQLALIAIWAASGTTPFYLRWPVAYLALWAACWPLVNPAPTPIAEVWRIFLMWDVAPHALLTFTVFCICRAWGMRIAREAQTTATAPSRRRFTLRHLLAWVVAIALLSGAWLQVLMAARHVPWPSLQTWQLVAIGLARSASLTAFDVATLWAVVRPGHTRWRLALLVTLVVAIQLSVWHFGEQAISDRFIRKWSFKLEETAWFDLGYFGAVLAAIFLVRWRGYRWSTPRSVSP